MQRMKAEEFLRWRRARKISKVQCAELFDVSVDTIRRWERGIRPIPGYVPWACTAIRHEMQPWSLPEYFPIEKK